MTTTLQWQTGTPPVYQEVLIYLTFPNEIIVKPKILIGWCDDTGRWSTLYGKVSGVVTHWQLLPSPPENIEVLP